MFSTSDTIVAIATPPGRGGIGVVRISGPESRAISGQLIAYRGDLEPRHATLTHIRAATKITSIDPPPGIQIAPPYIDQAIVTFFPGPHSYTGEDVVELSAHGSPVVLRAIVELAIGSGARLAEPGEFTLRAFLNGRIDLPQAEAVGDLINSVTPLQARVAFDQLEGTLTQAIAAIDAALFDLIAKLEASVDFPDEGYHFVEPDEVAQSIDVLCARTSALLADARRGRIIREGLQVAIVGLPNVGKSSLFNALIGASRAIVSDTEGTTRDLVTETIDLDGVRVTLVDTAGLRGAADSVEAEGIARSNQARAVADLVLHVVDGDPSRNDPVLAPIAEPDEEFFVVQNKIDRFKARRVEARAYVSATTGEGLGELRRAIAATLDSHAPDARRDQPAMTNVRHTVLVERAHDALRRARDAARAAGGALSEEFVLADLQEARAALEEVSGKRAPEALLEHVFERFCVGK